MCGASVPAITQKVQNIVSKRHVFSEVSAKHHIYLPAALRSLFNPEALHLQAMFCSETEFEHFHVRLLYLQLK